MAYDLDQFVSDCRAILQRDGGPKGREQVRLKLEQLLGNRDFVETYCGDQVPRGLKVLYEDPDLGFQILAHINDKARVSPPCCTAPARTPRTFTQRRTSPRSPTAWKYCRPASSTRGHGGPAGTRCPTRPRAASG